MIPTKRKRKLKKRKKLRMKIMKFWDLKSLLRRRRKCEEVFWGFRKFLKIPENFLKNFLGFFVTSQN